MILYRARWVVPVSSAPIEHGAVGVRDGRITYVGPLTGAPDGDLHDLGEVLLLPGLVNVHTHLELTGMRGFLEGLAFRDWIVRLTTAKRAVLDRGRLLDAARLGLVEGIRSGITTYADTCDSGVAFDAMLERGVRGIMYQEVFGPDPLQSDESMSELRAKVDVLRSRETALVRAGISPHAPYTVSDALFRASAEYARAERLPMAIHIAESDVETELVVAGAGIFADGLRRRGIEVLPRAESPVRLLAALGVLGDARPLLIHCVRLDAADIASIADHRCGVAHCPASNAKLGHGISPLRELLDAGVDVGLGSDSVASNNRMDVLEEARLAALFQGARLQHHGAVGAHEALELATLGGARALGMEAEIGSLDVGKQADLAAFRLSDARGVPTFEPEVAAVFALPGHSAEFVAVAGRELLRDGRLLEEDQALFGRVQADAELLRRWLASHGAAGIDPPESATR